MNIKRTLFAVAVLLGSNNLQADGIDMLTGNPEWDYNSYSTGDYWSIEPTYKIDDDNMKFMVKNGNTYHKIYLLELLCEDSSEGEMYAFAEPCVGIREANGKVFAEYESYMALTREVRTGVEGELPFLVTEDKEILLYDYTVGVGDKYPTSDVCAPIFVSSVETVTISDGMKRKLITLDNGLELLEGIGCLNSNGLLLHYLYTSGHWFQDYYGNKILHKLCMYYKNGILVYDSAAKNNGIALQRTQPQQPVLLRYDLSGRRFFGIPDKGIYIQNGRKQVLKTVFPHN